MVDSIGPGANTVPVPNERAGQAPVGRVGAEVAVVPGQGQGEEMLTFTTGVGSASVPVLALPRNMDADVMMTLLYAVQEKQGQDQIKTAETRIDDKQTARQKKHEEIMDKIKKMHEAEHKGGVGAKVGMAFGWIGVGLAWIAVGVVAVVSGGAAAVPLAVAATAMTALMICQQTGATDKAVKAMNLDEKGAMGVQIGLAAAMLVVNIGACILSGGAAAGGVASGVANVAAAGAEAGAAGAEVGTTGAEAGAAAGEVAAASVEATTDASVAGAEAGGTTAESAAGVGEETSTATDTVASTTQRSGRLVQVANRVRSAATIAQAVPQAGGGSAQVATSDYRYQAATARADTQDEKAELAEMQEVTLEDLRRIRKLIEEMQNAATMVIGTIDESRETEMHIRRTI
ncbi:MAG: type III secretion system translocon subunit SctE [Gammaproteobacteria bacterium]|nr:type III secretion system translocon subunit SctE [Gammaproteobacteria bacterium]